MAGEFDMLALANRICKGDGMSLRDYVTLSETQQTGQILLKALKTLGAMF